MNKSAVIFCFTTLLFQGCSSVNSVDKVGNKLQGSWSGSFVEEFEIRPSLNQNGNEDLAKSLTNVKFKEFTDSVKFVFDETSLKMFRGNTHFYSLDNLSIVADGKEIEVINTVEPKQTLSFIIKKLTQDSLILKDNNNTMYLNGKANPADPDTIAIQQYYSLRKTK